MRIQKMSLGVMVLVAGLVIVVGLYITTDGFADTAATTRAPVLAPSTGTTSETVVSAREKSGSDAGSLAMENDERIAAPTTVLSDATKASAVFANGCFWCVEHDLEPVPGVMEVISGYTGGASGTPTYANHTAAGHREAVLVTYNPQILSYANLVEHIIKHGDPTDAAGSFYDRGPQYAPAIYYSTEAEAATARAVIAAVDETGVFAAALPLPVLARTTFYPAEDYHQDYAKNNTLKYSYYRNASGRTAYIDNVWGDERTTFTISNALKPRAVSEQSITSMQTFTMSSWENYVKPDAATLTATLSEMAFTVTQKDGTERSGTSPLDKNYERGIYVDIVSGEPVFSSRDKFDSGTGWPSFVAPITQDAVTLHEDKKLFSTRTEVRSRFADSHLGHVFNDGPKDRGGMRYCMNGAALRFIAEADMEKEGYSAWLLML